MKTSTKQARKFRPTLGRIAVALTLASAMGSLSIAPAFGDNDDHRGRPAARGERHGDRDFRGRGPGYRPGYYRPYGYAAPVYAPAPIYYPPQPSPGVSLFLPLNVRIR